MRSVRTLSGFKVKAARPVAAALILALAGCAEASRTLNLTPEPVDAASPIAAQVVSASRANLPFVDFASIPRAPADKPTPASLKEKVVDLVAARRSLNTQVAQLPGAPTDMDAFVGKNRAVIERLNLKPVGADQAAQTESFAAELKILLEKGLDHAPTPSAPPSANDVRPPTP